MTKEYAKHVTQTVEPANQFQPPVLHVPLPLSWIQSPSLAFMCAQPPFGEITPPEGAKLLAPLPMSTEILVMDEFAKPVTVTVKLALFPHFSAQHVLLQIS